MLECVKSWMHDWGDLVLTGVIAWAAIMQWVVSRQLFKLSKAVEDLKNKPVLFCRINGSVPEGGLPYSSIEAQLSNLSSFGIWIEEGVITTDGEFVTRPKRSFPVGAVLRAGETFTQSLFEMPFDDLVPLNTKGTVTIQVKFYYFSSPTIGMQSSPIYEVTIDGTVATKIAAQD